MKQCFTLLFFIVLSFCSKAQNFTGQWKGAFSDNSISFVGYGGDKIEYVIELESSGRSVNGYSYTYFTDGGKKYYTICKVKGKINPDTKEVIVTEYVRTKYNTPKDFQNCFQTHRLTYFKNGEDSESLEGTWIPAPNQVGDCGYGKTMLTRRLLKRNVPFIDNTLRQKTIAKKDTPFKDLNSQKAASPPVVKVKPIQKGNATKDKIRDAGNPPIVKNEKVKPAETNKNITKEVIVVNPPVVKKDDKIVLPSTKFEKRTNTLVKKIEIEKETFSVDLYDNGDIDGDTVSVFYNGRLLLSHQRLSDKPLTINLTLDEGREENELTMYAENLGEIPPNTALMVVRDGDRRYETRITSDNQKNGTISFIPKRNR